jgi:hypothetical protein
MARHSRQRANLRIERGLPFVSLEIGWQQAALTLPSVLLDTGSAGTVLAVDSVEPLGIRLEQEDPINRIVGVGGGEFVFCKRIPWLALGPCRALDMPVELGALDYGFPIDGILGLDFMRQVGLVIDLGQLRARCCAERIGFR